MDAGAHSERNRIAGERGEELITVLQGDCRELLATLADASVQCCVTSPPYYGLRDYGTSTWSGGDPNCDHRSPTMQEGRNEDRPMLAGSESTNKAQLLLAHRSGCGKCGAIKVDSQIGLEPSPNAYIAELVAVFREVRRVLRNDGTVWLNLGDSYCSTDKWGGGVGGNSGKHVVADGGEIPSWAVRQRKAPMAGIKPKDLLMIPARVAIALQNDGWWLRSDTIWAKKNCMPESVINRPSSAHEHVFLLVKSGNTTFWTHRECRGTRNSPSPDYRWINRDTEEETAIEPLDWRSNRIWRRINLWDGHDYFYDAEAIKEDGVIPAGTRAAKGSNVRSELKDVNGRPPEYWDYTGTRNARNVWSIATQPYPDSHFAVMPPELAEKCIKSGTSERGACPHCGAAWVRELGEKIPTGGRGAGNGFARPERISVGGRGDETIWNPTARETIGWQPSCTCSAADPVPCVVLDPFGGAGTTGLVADRLGRNATLIELSVEYCAMARRRLTGDCPLFTEVAG